MIHLKAKHTVSQDSFFQRLKIRQDYSQIDIYLSRESQTAAFVFQKSLRFYIDPYESNYIERIFSIRHQMIKRKLIRPQFPEKESFNASLSINGQTTVVTIIKKFKNGRPLQTILNSGFSDPAGSTQHKDKSSILKTIEVCLQHVGLKDFLFTYDSLIVDQIGQVFINSTTLVGLRLIIFQQSISHDQFLQIALFIDRNIFKRKPNERINYMSMVRFLCFYLLSIVLNKSVQLLEPSEVPARVTKEDVAQLLEKQHEKIVKLIAMKSVKSSIKVFQKEHNLNIYELLYEVLIKENYVSCPQLLSMIFPSCIITQNMREIQQLLACIGHHSYTKLSEKQRKQLAARGYWSNKAFDFPIRSIIYQFLGLRQLKISCQVLNSHKSFAQYILDEHKCKNGVSGAWQHLLKSNYFSHDFPSENNMINDACKILCKSETLQKSLLKNKIDKKYSDLAATKIAKDCKNDKVKASIKQLNLPQESLKDICHEVALFEPTSSTKWNGMKQFAQRQLTFKLEVGQVQIGMEHQQLKTLKKYWRLMNT